MDSSKYSRSVSLLCPTCGGAMFEFEQGVDQTIELGKCVRCGRQISKDELIRENGENISEHATEIGKDVAKDMAEELRKTLKDAFRGSKFIKIK